MRFFYYTFGFLEINIKAIINMMTITITTSQKFSHKNLSIPSENIALMICNKKCSIKYNFKKLVGLAGFEPATPALSGQCSNQLSYNPII